MKKPRMTGLRWLGFVALLGVCAGIFWLSKTNTLPPPAPLPPVRVALDIWPGNFWVLVAEKKGYFAQEGLPVKIVDVSANYDSYLDELVKGNLDVHVVSAFDLVEQNMKGGNLIGLLSTDESLTAEGIVAKPEFTSLKALKGKRIGVEVGSFLDFFLDVAMGNSDIAEGQYTKVDIPTDDLVSEFQTQHLDAAISWEPVLGDLMSAYGAKKVFVAKDIKGLSPSILAVRAGWAYAHPENVEKLVNAWYKATAFMLAHPEETIAMVHENHFAESPQGQFHPADEIRDLMEQDKISDLAKNIRSFSFTLGVESFYSNLQYVARYLQEKNRLETPPNTDLMLDPGFIRSLSSRLSAEPF